MAIVSDDITIILAVWAALEADEDFVRLVKLGNRIKETLKQGQGVRYNPESKPNKQNGDLVEVDIDVGVLTAAPVMVTFGRCTRDEAVRQSFYITILTDDLGLNKSSLVKASILRGLRAAGNTLGIPKATLPIKSWEIATSTMSKDKPPQVTGGKVRREQKLTLAVTYHKKS